MAHGLHLKEGFPMDPTKRRSRILTVVLICLVACALLLCVLHPSAEHLYVLEVQGDSITVISNGRVLATGPYPYSVIYCIFAD